MATTEKIEYLDPAKVLVEDNARFALLGFRVDSLAESILAQDGIKQPVEVEPYEGDGFKFRLTSGFYRHAALSKLNKDGAGLKLPAIVRQPADDLSRLKAQLAENVERQDMTPMDIAIAARKLLDSGVSREDVRAILRRPGGKAGKAGVAMQPMSPAMLNIYLAFLEFPKKIQTLIHDGRIGVKAAYELSRHDKTEWDGILAAVEEKRQNELTKEAKADERADKEATTEAERAAKEAEKVKALADAEKAAKDAEESKKAAQKAIVDAQKDYKAVSKPPDNYLLPESEGGMSADDKKAFATKMAESKAALREAEKALKDAEKRANTANKTLTSLRPKEKASETEKAKPAPVTQDEVKTAAREKGSKPKGETGPIALTAKEAQAEVAVIMGSKFAGVQSIAAVFGKLLRGEINGAMAERELGVITGERKTKKA